MVSVEVVPARYTVTLTQQDIDNLRAILRGYIAPNPYSTKRSRADEIAWLVEAVWDESVWGSPWLYSWEAEEDED